MGHQRRHLRVAGARCSAGGERQLCVEAASSVGYHGMAAIGAKVSLDTQRRGPAFYSLPPVPLVSKRRDSPFSPGRGLRRKTNASAARNFVVVGWTDPEGSCPFIGALLPGTTTPAAGWFTRAEVGSGTRVDQLDDLLPCPQPLQTDKMPLDVAPPRATARVSEKRRRSHSQPYRFIGG